MELLSKHRKSLWVNFARARLKTIEEASELYAQTKEHNFEAKAAEEQAKLLKYALVPPSPHENRFFLFVDLI